MPVVPPDQTRDEPKAPLKPLSSGQKVPADIRPRVNILQTPGRPDKLGSSFNPLFDDGYDEHNVSSTSKTPGSRFAPQIVDPWEKSAAGKPSSLELLPAPSSGYIHGQVRHWLTFSNLLVDETYLKTESLNFACMQAARNCNEDTELLADIDDTLGAQNELEYLPAFTSWTEVHNHLRTSLNSQLLAA